MYGGCQLREVNFRSPSSKAVQQHRKGPAGHRFSETGGEVHRLFAKLLRILRQPLSKIRLGSCARLDPTASKLQPAAFCCGVHLQRRILAEILTPCFPPTNYSLCTFCARCRQTDMALKLNNFRDLHREAFTEGKPETKRSSLCIYESKDLSDVSHMSRTRSWHGKTQAPLFAKMGVFRHRSFLDRDVCVGAQRGQ